jgi:hypothetical protein|tara:strand:- start:1260 stop:1415 length:156 start_codon:yes stop_codon:yes gene_type:complete
MGAVTYYGNAQKIYVATEAAIGMGLGLLAGGAWKMWHWETRKKIEAFHAKK